VLVYLGQSIWERVADTVHRVVERDIDQRGFGEYPLDLSAERAIETVIVVGVQEPSVSYVVSQRFDLAVRQADVSVARQVQVGVVSEVRVRQTHLGGPARHPDGGALAYLAEEIGQTGWVCVPVPSTLVMDASDRGEESRFRILLSRLRVRGCQDGIESNKHSRHTPHPLECEVRSMHNRDSFLPKISM